MEPERYVILRSPGGGGPGVGGAAVRGGTRSGGSAGGPIEVETAELTTRSEVEDLVRDDEVVGFAEVMPMKLMEPEARNVACDPDVGSTWGVQAVKADTSPLDGSGVTVAILDTGIDISHPAFAGMTNIVQQDFTGEGDGDPNGHGTHCAGTVFGQDVDGVRIGVARGVERALIGKVLGGSGGGTTEQILEGLNWAIDNGAHIISMSLGMDFPGLVEQLVQRRGFSIDLATSTALVQYANNINVFRTLAEYADSRADQRRSATMIVAASGNESERDRNPNHALAAAPPSAAKGIISVGALGRSDAGWKIADFSNTGPRCAGPGVEVRSAEANQTGLTAMNGTSMATPHVAGVAALWAQKQLELLGTIDSFSLKAQVTAHCDLAGLAPGFEPEDIGQGMVQAPQ